MKEYFDGLVSIAPSECLGLFWKHIEDRLINGNTEDAFERQIYNTLESNSTLNYYCGCLNEQGFRNLILPHHTGSKSCRIEGTDREVPEGGKSLSDAIKLYSSEYIPDLRFPSSLSKIFGQLERFYCSSAEVIDADFLLVSNWRQYAHPGDTHYSPSHDGANKIFIANGFHRLVAYGLWVDKNGFKPLKVYYAT